MLEANNKENILKAAREKKSSAQVNGAINKFIWPRDIHAL